MNLIRFQYTPGTQLYEKSIEVLKICEQKTHITKLITRYKNEYHKNLSTQYDYV